MRMQGRDSLPAGCLASVSHPACKLLSVMRDLIQNYTNDLFRGGAWKLYWQQPPSLWKHKLSLKASWAKWASVGMCRPWTGRK